MNELPGALERPGGSRVRITASGASTVVVLPPPSVPLPLALTVVAAALTTLAIFVVGFCVFVLQRPFPGYEFLLNEPYRRMPLASLLAGLGGWLLLLAGGAATLLAVGRPLTRREEIAFEPERLVYRERALGRAREQSLTYREAGAFRARRDEQGLMQPQLLLLLNRPSPRPGGDEIEIAQSLSEEEKLWLESVLSVLLARRHL